jgi:hypothetical protein
MSGLGRTQVETVVFEIRNLVFRETRPLQFLNEVLPIVFQRFNHEPRSFE